MLWAIARRTLRFDSDPVGHTANPEIELPCDCFTSVPENSLPAQPRPSHALVHSLAAIRILPGARRGRNRTAVEKGLRPVEIIENSARITDTAGDSLPQFQRTQHAFKRRPEGVEIGIRGHKDHISQRPGGFRESHQPVPFGAAAGSAAVGRFERPAAHLVHHYVGCSARV